MRNQLLFILTILLALFQQLFAQEITQTIRGQIKDMDSGYPLVGATIQVENHQGLWATTDMDGNFSLENVPVGRQNLLCSYIGYKSKRLENVLLNSAKEKLLIIQMVENIATLDEVVINTGETKKPVNTMILASASTLKMEETNRFSGSMGDLSRMAQNFAGVSGVSDNRNDIIVRGNSPSNVLWRLEGIDIPSPNHWSILGTTGGPISMLNTNNLRSSDFLSGAFPAEYGNVTGAVFDLRLANGNTEKFEYLGQIGFNGFEGKIEGPLKNVGKNASFFINYRYSTLELMNKLGMDFGTGSAVPEYQDMNFKLNFPTEKAGTFSLWGLGGISDIKFEANPDEETNSYAANDLNLVSGAKTGMVGLKHQYFFNTKTSYKLSAAYTNTRSTNSAEEILFNENDEIIPFFRSVQDQEKMIVDAVVNSKLNAKNRFRAGVNFENTNIKLKDSVFIDKTFWYEQLNFDGQTSLLRSFVQWNHKLNEKWEINTGLNSLYLTLNSSFAIDPRFSLAFQATDRTKLALAYGKHSQTQPLPIYFYRNEDLSEAENLKNRELDFIKSHHIVFSTEHFFTEKLKLKTELYSQFLYDLAVDPHHPTYSVANLGSDFGFPNYAGLVNEGTGLNYGAELTLQQSLDKGFYYLGTVSIFNSTYKAYDEVERSTHYNSNYVFNLLIGKEFPLSSKFVITTDAKINFSGGRRYTPIDLVASIAAGEQVLDESQAYGLQYPEYIRPDVKIGFRMNRPKTTQTFSIDFQNVINRENILLYSYYNPGQEILTHYNRGFYPDIRWQILF